MLLFSPFDLIAAAVALVFAYPWALILLPRDRRNWLLVLLTTLALSLGGLTVGMMLLALIDKLMLAWVLAGVLVAFSLGSGWMMRAGTLRQTVPPRALLSRAVGAMRDHPLLALMAILVLVMAGLILFNALYWPFGDDDAVSIYAMQARGIYQTRDLPKGEGLYEAYPMLIPLSYVYAYLAAGEMNEYLARLFPAALALGTLGAAVSLGWNLFNRRVGLFAATLLALTPAFVRWGSSGYTDVPSAFFFTMAVIFAWRMAQARGKRDAVLMGLMVGFAMWTKNSTLTLVLSVPAWLLYATWRKQIGARHWGLALGSMALAGGPWYVRNWIEFGLLVPKTAWTDRAVHSVRTLFPLVGNLDQFSVIGPLLTIGLLWAIFAVVRARDGARGRDENLLLWIFVLPFAAAWWWMASYEVRFLLTVLPLDLCDDRPLPGLGYPFDLGRAPPRPAAACVAGDPAGAAGPARYAEGRHV